MSDLKYFNPQGGHWPGTRTKNLHIDEPRLHMYFTQKLNYIFLHLFFWLHSGDFF